MSRPGLERRCSTEFECRDMFGICVENVCQCSDSDWLNGGLCTRCPGLGISCNISKCCSDASMICGPENICTCRNLLENVLSCDPEPPIYITASQIALSGALVMGIAALTMIIYRLCKRPRYLNARQRALASQADADSITYANMLRASLTSMQIRVLTRLRDRPPSYENREAAVIQPDLPPPYEVSTLGTSLPPIYSEIVVSNTGYTNEVFVDLDADPPPMNRPADGGVGNGNLTCDISQSTSDTSDKDKVHEADEKADADSDENRIHT